MASTLPSTQSDHLDPHEKPPEALRAIFKKLKGPFDESNARKNGVVDLELDHLPTIGTIPENVLTEILGKFQGLQDGKLEADMQVHRKVYSFSELPGKPSLVLLISCIGISLVSKLVLIVTRTSGTSFLTAFFQSETIALTLASS